MVYFPLNINEELADLLRSATELNGLLNNYVKEHFKDLDYQDCRNIRPNRSERCKIVLWT